MVEITDLKFDDSGLIPAIVIDSATKQVLMLAYMNQESLKISEEKGLACFYSRSRQELWLKGETSGNYQKIISIFYPDDEIFTQQPQRFARFFEFIDFKRQRKYQIN